MPILKEFQELTNDQDRWTWVRENQDKGIIVMLDNDSTFVVANGGDDYASFDCYLGWSDGVVELLANFGIKCESV